jgi:RNA polymerase-binding transcription factor DksA
MATALRREATRAKTQQDLEATMKTPSRKGTRRSSRGPKQGSTTRAILGRQKERSAVGRVNPKWAWHYRVLIRLRDRLLKDRGEHLTEAAERLEPHSMHMADSAGDEFDHDLALSQLAAEQDALYEVEEAIHRILDGSYGGCEVSGKAIPAARLKAIPWTRFAKEVETRLEQKGVVGHPQFGKLHSVRTPENTRLAATPEEIETREARREKADQAVNEATQEEPEPSEEQEEQ